MGMRVGYARVSSLGQKLDVQLDKLSDCDRIYHEKVSAGSTKLRIELQKALDFVRDDDIFVVTKLDRLARSVVDLSIIVQRLEEKKVLDQGIDMKQIRPSLLALNSDVELLGTTEFGVVRVRLTGECCSGRLKRLMTIIDIERKLKIAAPGVKVVTDIEQSHYLPL